MTRPSELQALFEAAERAIRHSAGGSAAAKAAAVTVFDRLRAQQGAVSAVPPVVLPVCDHLDAALSQAHATRRDVAAALQALAPALVWTRRRSARPEDAAFWDGHANAMLAGPGGLEARDDLWLGVTVMAPGVTYDDHSHPPEETYLALTPGQWWNTGMDWTDPGPDGLIHNPPGITHAMRATAERPFLALWVLPV